MPWQNRVFGLFLALALPAIAPAQQSQGEPNESDHAVELYLSNDALQAQYIRPMDLGQRSPLEVRGGVFYNEDRDLIVNGDILAPLGNPARRQPIEVRAGARAYGAFIALEN